MLSFYCNLAFIKSPSFCFFKYFYMETTKVKLNALFIALLPLLGSPVIHAETTLPRFWKIVPLRAISPRPAARAA